MWCDWKLLLLVVTTDRTDAFYSATFSCCLLQLLGTPMNIYFVFYGDKRKKKGSGGWVETIFRLQEKIPLIYHSQITLESLKDENENCGISDWFIHLFSHEQRRRWQQWMETSAEYSKSRTYRTFCMIYYADPRLMRQLVFDSTFPPYSTTKLEMMSNKLYPRFYYLLTNSLVVRCHVLLMISAIKAIS